MQRKTTTLLKLTLSLALLAAIVAYSGPREVLGALRSVNPALIALGFGLLLADALVSVIDPHVRTSSTSLRRIYEETALVSSPPRSAARSIALGGEER